MQRINLFPNPVFAGPLTGIAHWGDADGTVRDNALHVTGTNGGYGFNVMVPFNVPLVLSMRVDASEDNVAGMLIIQPSDRPGVNNTLASQKFKRGISDVLQRFTVTSNGLRFEVNPNGIRDVAVSNVLIERADTYDTAVGGASGLLLGGHDATRLRRSVGRVMSDDDNEPMHEPILDHHLASRQVGASHDRSERGWDGILGQFRCERHRRHCLDYRNTGRIQRKPTCQPHDAHQQFQSVISELFRQVRQSDRHRDKYTHLHAGRLSGEQDSARRHRIFLRGYDAARLTLTGVMA